MMKLLSFFKEVKGEVVKVVWPTPKEAMAISGVVCFVVSIVALLLFVMDAGIYHVIQWLLKV